MSAYGGGGWNAWRRSADYYDEGTLIWLGIDTKIRQLTNGQRSLDDFCRRFYGGGGSLAEVKPYTFQEVVAEVNAVAPHDWRKLLAPRLTETGGKGPQGGLRPR